MAGITILDFDDSDFNIAVAGTEADVSLNYGSPAYIGTALADGASGQPPHSDHVHAWSALSWFFPFNFFGIPSIFWGNLDYMTYDTASDVWQWFIASTQVAALSAAGLAVDAISVDVISEKTADAGVTAGDVLLKDGLVDGVDIAGRDHPQVHGPSVHTGFANWKIIYTDGNGDQQEIALGANGTVLGSNGPSAAPAFKALDDSGIISFGISPQGGQAFLPT